MNNQNKENKKDIVDTYSDIIKDKIKTKESIAAKMIQFGLRYEKTRCHYFQNKKMPKAYKYLNYHAIKMVSDALSSPHGYIWANIFAPVEILQCFDIAGVSIEGIASYLSGFRIEDMLIDRAEDLGIASTLCSYHKAFIGAVDAHIIPKPIFAMTTSMVCDGNINTFDYMKREHGIDDYVIDIPHRYDNDSEKYVVDQLWELISILENKTGKRFDIDRLSEILDRENKSKKHYLSFLDKRKTHAYPNTLVLILFTLFASHIDVGSKWAYEFYKMLDEDIDNYPISHEKRLFWVHLTPYAQPTLQRYLNYGDKMSISADDFNLDYIEMLDISHPIESLARKMILNIYNGDFARKVDMIEENVKKYNCDGVIEFCHWGCKQTAGGAMLLKERMKEIGIPMLILDGDAIDRRNSSDGQIRTRFEAFMEVLGC